MAGFSAEDSILTPRGSVTGCEAGPQLTTPGISEGTEGGEKLPSRQGGCLGVPKPEILQVVDSLF